MASLANVEHRNQDATVYVANLDYACTQTVLLELFAQVGKVKSIYMPTDKITGSHNGYGFVEFTDVLDADYAIQILNMIKFYDRPLKLGKSSLRSSKAELWSKDVGANLFIGNLDPIDVDEHLLYDTFSSFGTLLKQPKIMREDNETNDSKGFGFVSFDNFESSDTAIECMNSQFLCSRQIIVQYAFKKDTTTNGNGKDGNNTNTTHSHERHGSRAERMLAAQRNSQQNKQPQKQQPTTRNNPAMPSRPGMSPPMMMMMGNNNMGSMMGNNMNRNMNMTNNSGMGTGVPPPPPPPMMNMMGGGGGYNGRSGGGSSQQPPPPGNYGPGPVSNGGGFGGGGNNNMGGGGRGGRGRGLSMTQPAWMTQQQNQNQQQGLGGMPPPPPPSTMMGGGGAPPPPPPPPPLPPMMQSQSQSAG
jgi:splicing factor 3B subunit 4